MNKAYLWGKLGNESQAGLNNHYGNRVVQDFEESLCSLFFDFGFKVMMICENLK